MALTLKQMLDAVMLESSLDPETVYYTATDYATRRLVALADRSATRLSTQHTWQALRRTYSFSLSTDTDYAMPDDFRELVPDTAYQNDYIESIDMRTDPGWWGYLQSASGGSGMRGRFRILGGRLHVYEPVSGDDVRFEYVSSHPILATDGTTTRARWGADTDTFKLDDDLLIMDVTWRYQRLIGLESWEDHRGEFNTYLRTVKGQEAGAKTIIGGEYAMGFQEPYTDLWVDNP